MPESISNFNGNISIKDISNKKTNNNIKVVKKNANNILDKNSFLKLLVTELSQQNPMKPMNDREFISQMAQFSSLEQMNNVSNSMEKLYKFQATQLVGKSITGKDFVHSKPITGTVDSVFYDGEGSVFLNVKGKRIKMEDVISIKVNEPIKKTKLNSIKGINTFQENQLKLDRNKVSNQENEKKEGSL